MHGEPGPRSAQYCMISNKNIMVLICLICAGVNYRRIRYTVAGTTPELDFGP